LGLGLSSSVGFAPLGDASLTHGRAGLLYWPIHRRSPELQIADCRLQNESGQSATCNLQSAICQIGPPRTLFPALGTGERAGWDRQGNRLAFTDWQQSRALVLDADRSAPQVGIGRA